MNDSLNSIVLHSFQKFHTNGFMLLFVQLLSRVQLFAALWTGAHTRLPCPSPSPRVFSNSCPLNQWCYLTISSSTALFSFCLQYFPASGSFQMSQFFTSGGQSIGASASSISPSKDYSGLISLRIDCFDHPYSPRDSQESSPAPQFKSTSFSGLSLLYDPTLTSLHDSWKNHRIDRPLSAKWCVCFLICCLGFS